METEQVYYTETQNFRKSWTLFILIACDVVFSVFLVKSWHPIDSGKLGMHISLILLMGLINALYFTARMETRIDKNGISFRYFPFILKEKIYLWRDVEECYVRKFKPMAEYGGWGVRLGIFGFGKAYTLKGNNGIQLVLKNKNKVLLGTQNPDALLSLLPALLSQLKSQNNS